MLVKIEYDFLMIEADTIVFQDFKFKVVIAIIIAMLVPNIFRALKYLIFVRKPVRNQAI